MFKIIKDGLYIGYTDHPVYIRQLESGVFSPCDKDEASGISFQSTPYNLVDAPASPMVDKDGVALPLVVLENTDAGTVQSIARDNTTALQVLLADMYEATLLN